MSRKIKGSIFTDDLSRCYITGQTTGIEIHHVFGGGLRDVSTEYNFVCPLHATVHPNGVHCTSKNWVDLDHYLKRMCQEYFLEHHGTRDDWYRIFGRFYDDRTNEAVWRNNE